MHRLQLWLAKRQLMPKPHCLRVSCGRNLNPSVLQYYHVLHSDLEARNKKFLLQLFKAQWLLYASAPVTSKKILHAAHTVQIQVLCDCPKKKIDCFLVQRWIIFITETECVYCAVRSTFYVLPIHCIYAFCVDLGTNSDYFAVQHWLTGFYNRYGVCLLRGTFYILRSAHTLYLCVLCGSKNKQRLFRCTALTDWFLWPRRSVFTARYVLHSTFSPHSVFMCSVWIWEQTAIIPLYSINWLVGFYNWDGVFTARYGLGL